MYLKNSFLLSLSLTTYLWAGTALAENFTTSPAYKECTGLSSSNPQAAFDKAEAWLKLDDSVAAHHCRAMALYGLKRYDESATELDVVRTKIAPAEIALRSYVTRQSSRAWIEAGKPDFALRSLDAQINEMSLAPSDNATQARLTTELLLDKSRIRVEYGQLANAVQDLDQAISLSPGSEVVLMQRAKIFAQLGDNALAKQDLQVILRMNPTHQEAIGLMRVLRDLPDKS